MSRSTQDPPSLPTHHGFKCPTPAPHRLPSIAQLASSSLKEYTGCHDSAPPHPRPFRGPVPTGSRAARAMPTPPRLPPNPLADRSAPNSGKPARVRGEPLVVRPEPDALGGMPVESPPPDPSLRPTRGHPTTNLRAISGEPAPNTPRGQHPDFGPQRTPKPAKSDPRAAEEFFRKNSYSRACPPLSPIRPTSPRPACPQPVPAPGEPVEPQPPHPKRRRISHPPARNTPEGFRAGGCEYPQKATAITCANRQSARPSPHGTHPRH